MRTAFHGDKGMVQAVFPRARSGVELVIFNRVLTFRLIENTNIVKGHRVRAKNPPSESIILKLQL